MFEAAVNQLMQTAVSPMPIPFETLQQHAGSVVNAGSQATPDARTYAIGRMVDTILEAEPLRAAMIALTCGALVEQGANPYVAVHAILTRLGGIIGDAAPFAQACLDRAQADGFDGDPITKYGDSVRQTMSKGAAAISAMDIFCRPAIAMLSRSKRARRATLDEGRMIARARRFPVEHAMLAWLRDLLNVLDDEDLIVIHPENKQGVQVNIEGINGNHQLFVLLEDLFIGSHMLPGERPAPDVVKAAKHFRPADHPPYTFAYQYANWQALQLDGTLSTDDTFWLWGEGIPADIAKVDTMRVMLMMPPNYSRTFIISTLYEGLTAEISLLKRLSTAEVETWLERIKSQPR
jgi:hypothetical protein